MEYTSRANQAIAVSETGTDERSAFIIKTYVHLLGAIIAFTAIEVAFFKSGFALKLTELIMGSTYGYLLAMGAF
ncbi:MAG: hypothetical protein ACI84E_002410, partial [Planctomycetota bacterium]